MEDLKRYAEHQYDNGLFETPYGDWVKYKDYQKLQTEVQRLTEENERLEQLKKAAISNQDMLHASIQHHKKRAAELEQRLKGQEGFVMISPETCKSYEAMPEKIAELEADLKKAIRDRNMYKEVIEQDAWIPLRKGAELEQRLKAESCPKCEYCTKELKNRNARFCDNDCKSMFFAVERISPPNSDKD